MTFYQELQLNQAGSKKDVYKRQDYQIAKQNVEYFYAAQQSWDIEEDMKKKRQQAR